MIHHNGVHMQSFMNTLQFASYTKNPTCENLSQLLSTCSEWCDPLSLYVHRWCVDSQSMDLIEVRALLSILPWVSPCCGCCLQHLHVRGVSFVELHESQPFSPVVSEPADGIGFHQAVLLDPFFFGEGCGRTVFSQTGLPE